jgi:hypothetical protein
MTREEVAVKLKQTSQGSILQHEAQVYQRLAGGLGIPTLLWFGPESGHMAMVISRLGSSVEDLLEHSNRTLSLETVVPLIDQMVNYTILLRIADTDMYSLSYRVLSIFTLEITSTGTSSRTTSFLDVVPRKIYSIS